MRLHTATFQATERRAVRRRTWLVGGVLLVLIAIVALAARMSYVPADLDMRSEKFSAAGLYQVRYTAPQPIPLHELHGWELWIEDASGRPVTKAQITVDGDMPQHGHGLATQPRVTSELGEGGYLVEGIKFQMGGWWFVEFEVEGGA